MTLKTQMNTDMDVFYNIDEFGMSAKLDGNDLVVIQDDYYEVTDTRHRAYLAKSSDVGSINIGSTFFVENNQYKVINYDRVDDQGDEVIIVVEEDS